MWPYLGLLFQQVHSSPEGWTQTEAARLQTTAMAQTNSLQTTVMAQTNSLQTTAMAQTAHTYFNTNTHTHTLTHTHAQTHTHSFMLSKALLVLSSPGLMEPDPDVSPNDPSVHF